MDKTIIFFGRFELPDKNALAHRVKANAIAVRSLGYKTLLIGYRKGNDTLPDGNLETDGIPYILFNYPQKKREWLKDYRLYKKIESIINERGADSVGAIVFNGVGPGNIMGLLKISQKYNIPVVYDVVDWFSYDSGNIMFRIYKKAEDWITRKLLEPQIKNFICISTFLEKHYSSPNRRTVVIPSLTFADDSRFKVNSKCIVGETVTICYAGSPGIRGSKDRIDWVIRAFSEIDSKEAILKIYGISKEEFCEQFPEYTKLTLNERIAFYGRRPNKECIEAISSSDFFTFARTDNRMTRAGFPTKFAESLALHTPVITTPTSDLSLYIKNNETGFISSDCTYNSYKIAMKLAITTSKELRKSMRIYDSPLDEKNWEEKIKSFFDEIIEN